MKFILKTPIYFILLGIILLFEPSEIFSQTRLNFETGKNGKFDATFNEAKCELTITVKVTFSFSGAWTNEQAKTDFKNDILDKVDAHWSEKYSFEPKQPSEIKCKKIKVKVRMQEVASGQHFDINIRHTNAHRTSSVRRPNVNLDSKDMEQRERTTSDGKKRKQTGAKHEFGHMVGQPEDNTEGDGVMQYGDDILENNYDSFKEALKVITNSDFNTVSN